MAESSYAPGSRAIKIPISKLKKISTFKEQDHGTSMQRVDSTEGSSSEASSSTTPMKRDLQKTMYSPINMSTDDSRRKDKQKAFSPQSHPQQQQWSTSLSPSMLASSSYKSVNLNSHITDPDTPPRLICYTKSSQGFTWNDELFLPSYLIGRRYRGSRNRRWGQDEDEDDEMDEDDVPFDEEADRCPVTDIFVTDEEAARMLP